MRRAKAQDSEVDMLAAAFLAGEGRKQKDIADTLALSQAAVSRFLARARAQYLREEVRFLEENVPQADMQRVRQRIGRKKLQDSLDQLAKRNGQTRTASLRVFECGPGADIERIRRLGEFAAPHVKGLLVHARACGLTWGGMLASLLAGLRNLHSPAPWAKGEIQCLPLTGEPLGQDPVNFSSSSLAFELGRIVNSPSYHAPSLAMVPAFVPEGFSRGQIDGVWRLIGLVDSYRQVFGPHPSGTARQRQADLEPPLAERLDMLLTSVGTADKPLGFGQGKLFDTMNVNHEELKALIVAEVGGVCIPRPNLDKRQQRQFESFRSRWTGLRWEHLTACAARGGDPSAGVPGVVVVSGGKGRAAPICELIKLGLVNHLIVDDVLADELETISRAMG